MSIFVFIFYYLISFPPFCLFSVCVSVCLSVCLSLFLSLSLSLSLFFLSFFLSLPVLSHSFPKVKLRFPSLCIFNFFKSFCYKTFIYLLYFLPLKTPQTYFNNCFCTCLCLFLFCCYFNLCFYFCFCFYICLRLVRSFFNSHWSISPAFICPISCFVCFKLKRKR